MKIKKAILHITLTIVCSAVLAFNSSAHEIIFCGEKIPLADRFVAEKLMNIIKKQINYGIVNSLKKKDNYYIRTIEMYMDRTRLPDDFKYLAIVESGFKNAVSSAGAAGFWQLMPETARELGLIVNGLIDERNDFPKSTYAACKLIAQYYLDIKKKFTISSWVLTAAAYNNGIGNIHKAIKNQGNNYFEMDLNKETAEYVYKIIAVKELFEYPELYLKNFGYNIFNPGATARPGNPQESAKTDNTGFGSLSVQVDLKNDNAPDNNKNNKTVKPAISNNYKNEQIIFAHITGNYDNFKDSSEIKITLEDPLRIDNSFKSAGHEISGIGWKIDDKVYIDLGYGRKLIVIDYINKKHDGILSTALKDKQGICLMAREYYD